jgi:hypothetical protein
MTSRVKTYAAGHRPIIRIDPRYFRPTEAKASPTALPVKTLPARPHSLQD